MASITHTIIFDTNGGIPTQFERDIGVGDRILSADTTNVKREGYSIAGWYMKNGGKLKEIKNDTTYQVEYGHTCFAMWDGNPCTITWDPCNGQATTTTPKKYGNIFGAARADPSWVGYEFLGWFTKEKGGQPYNPFAKITGNAKFYAQWKDKYCTITFLDYEGNVVKSFQVRYNEKIGNRFPEDPERPWYTFSRWTSGGAEVDEDTSATNDISISPNFDPIDFNISYALDDGAWSGQASSRTTYNIELASDYSPPTPNPEKHGYVFDGWEPPEIKPKHIGDVTFIAKWKLATYTIIWDANIASYTGPKPEWRRYYETELGAFPPASITGYTLLGWFTEPTGGDQIYPTTKVSGDATYYAHWQKNTYTLTFDANGGKFSDEKTTKEVSAQYKDSVSTILPTPDPTLTGYTFIGWFTQQIGGSQLSTETVTGHATYYAQWQANTYTIYFHPCVLPEPPAPNGKVLYKTSADGEWLESDADITDKVFNGFSEKTSAVAVIIPSKDATGNNVTSIGYAAFYYCSDLTSVTIPYSVTNIGGRAFYKCSGLTKVTIPDQVTYIGLYAFRGCSALTSLTIPNSVTSIGGYAFFECSGLTSVTFLGKTLEQVQNIDDGYGNKLYPWGISNTSIINVANIESHGIKRGGLPISSPVYHYDQQMTYGVAKHLMTNEYTKNPAVSFNPWGQLPDWPNMNIIPTKQSSQWVIKKHTGDPTLPWSIQAFDSAPSTFIGWTTENSEGKKVYNENHYVSNLTTENNKVIHLYAVWKPGSVTLPGATNPGGWRFDGWYKGDKETFIGFAGDELGNVEAGTATYAKFTDIRITVTYFKNLGG